MHGSGRTFRMRWRRAAPIPAERFRRRLLPRDVRDSGDLPSPADRLREKSRGGQVAGRSGGEGGRGPAGGRVGYPVIIDSGPGSQPAGDSRPGTVLVMGVVERHPDSFSDGGAWFGAERRGRPRPGTPGPGRGHRDVGGSPRRVRSASPRAEECAWPGCIQGLAGRVSGQRGHDAGRGGRAGPGGGARWVKD